MVKKRRTYVTRYPETDRAGPRIKTTSLDKARKLAPKGAQVQGVLRETVRKGVKKRFPK